MKELKETIINTLNIKKNDRCLKYILNTFNFLNINNIENFNLEFINNGKILKIQSNNVFYEIILDKNNNIEAIKDLTNNEWIIKSIK